MASDPQLPEAFLELILLRQVVIRTQHAQEDTFSETARTDEKQAIRLILQQGQVHRLIYIILVRSTTSTKLETPYGILFAFSIALPFYRMIIQITNISFLLNKEYVCIFFFCRLLYILGRLLYIAAFCLIVYI